MHSYRKLAFYLTLSLCLMGTSCAQRLAPIKKDAAAPVVNDTASVLEIAREYRQRRQQDAAAPLQRQDERPFASSPNLADDELYTNRIKVLFHDRDFDQLEEEAHEARQGRGRFIGGAWKLFDFYHAVTTLPSGLPPKDAAWTYYLETLKLWEVAKPESATARIALAEAYVNYGWYARGEGTADTVTPSQWKLLGDRAELARSTLIEAARLKEKCPYWYEAMQHVAQAQGWTTAEARELMEQAVLFQPGYYHYYREFAFFLEPRWYGKEGDAEAFASETANRVGGREGAFLYFEIASLLTCQCNPDQTEMARLSWPKIKTGYAALEQLYGVSSLKRNRFAYMAYLAGDKLAAREAFVQIGDNWNKETWQSKEHFEMIRARATSP